MFFYFRLLKTFDLGHLSFNRGCVEKWDGDAGTGDVETRGRGDVGTWGHGDSGTRGLGDVGTPGLGDLGTWGRGDVGTWGCGDVGSRGRGHVGTGGCVDTFSKYRISKMGEHPQESCTAYVILQK